MSAPAGLSRWHSKRWQGTLTLKTAFGVVGAEVPVVADADATQRTDLSTNRQNLIDSLSFALLKRCLVESGKVTAADFRGKATKFELARLADEHDVDLAELAERVTKLQAQPPGAKLTKEQEAAKKKEEEAQAAKVEKEKAAVAEAKQKADAEAALADGLARKEVLELEAAARAAALEAARAEATEKVAEQEDLKAKERAELARERAAQEAKRSRQYRTALQEAAEEEMRAAEVERATHQARIAAEMASMASANETARLALAEQHVAQLTLSASNREVDVEAVRRGHALAIKRRIERLPAKEQVRKLG